MNNTQTVECGKIVTIKFNGPSKRPIYISIDSKQTRKKGAVCISPLTPLAKAILNRRTGEKIEFDSPEGKLGIKIIDVSA